MDISKVGVYGQGKLTTQTATKILRGKCRQIIRRDERD